MLLDTNIYGEIIIDPEIDAIKSMLRSKGMIIYGTSIIRKELRAVPKGQTFSDGNLRTHLLGLYHEIVGNHEIDMTNEMMETANAYYIAYKEFGGAKSKEKIFNDFLIVANASVKEMDIVVSEDEKSMLAENAIRAYSLVNKIRGKRLPDFIGYEHFKSVIKK